MCGYMPSSIKLAVLVILCLQNSFFTVLRRYSQGVSCKPSPSHEKILTRHIFVGKSTDIEGGVFQT